MPSLERLARLTKYGLIVATALVLPSGYYLKSVEAAIDPPLSARDSGWTAYGGQLSGNHYSKLKQINRANVNQLQVAWKYDTGEAGGLQTNPLIVGRTMYVDSPTLKIIALDAATGKEIWRFDSGTLGQQPSRGLCYWTDGRESRLLAGVLDHLYALDPATGKPILSFGEAGSIDLRQNLGEGDYTRNFAVLTTPGVLYKDMIIVGFRAPETKPAPHGDIRAYDVHTGKLRWSFHTIPHPGETGYESWPADAWKVTGAANNWPGMALDEQRGIVFVPTGSAVDDFYGGDRLGNDLYADTLLALDANTGKRIWHFQAVHHDIWDRDFPSHPTLVTVKQHGRSIDAVAQTTKQGFVFLFDRTTGKSLFPIEERKFPVSDVPGEVTSPTQPIPLLPAPYARQQLTADMLTQRTPEAHAWAVEQFKDIRSGGQFFPFSVGKQTVVFPGYDGGGEWGGPAVDPTSGVIYVNSNDVPWTGGLTEVKAGASLGENVYGSQCAVCHGIDRKGSPPSFPTLVDLQNRKSDTDILKLVHEGKGRMPSFPGLQNTQLQALLEYLRTGEVEGRTAPGTPLEDASSKREAESEAMPPNGESKYRFTGYRKFLDPDGYPAVVPPWGTLNAIDLNTGKYLWKIPLGEYPELAAKGIKDTGSENYGGPIVTDGGLVFFGATTYDRKFRAFNSKTGKLLWEAVLPFSGNATPATYMVDGKQYVVIATSGQRDRKGPQGAAYVAFALP